MPSTACKLSEETPSEHCGFDRMLQRQQSTKVIKSTNSRLSLPGAMSQLPLTSQVTLNKLFDHSIPQFPYLQNVGNKGCSENSQVDNMEST